jgi:hypothetical protein
VDSIVECSRYSWCTTNCNGIRSKCCGNSCCVAVPIPVAPVVAWVISVNTVLIHNVGVVLAALAVLFGVTVIVPVAFTAPHPPVSGIL